MNQNNLELDVMAHRYLYYVLAEPVLSDYEYDVVERKARAVLPAESPVQGVGSCLPNSYTAEQIARAQEFLKCASSN